MLELISSRVASARFERTVVLNSQEFAVGGAVCNLYWYFTQLGRKAAIATHYGAGDRARVMGLLPHDATEFFAEKHSLTDALVVLRNMSMPSVYLAGELAGRDIDTMLAGLQDTGTVVFAGSRHEVLRKACVERIAALRHATVVFSPSYTVYEYTPEELRSFLAHSHIAFVNKEEAEHLRNKLGAASVPEVMRSTRLGGIVTLGPEGANLYPAQHADIHIPSSSGSQEDVIGAGDSFVCGFLHSYLSSGSWQAAGEAGGAVAAQVVRDKRVRAPIDRSLIEA